MSAQPNSSQPVFAVSAANLIPVRAHLKTMATIPPSRMFLIKKSLKTYLAKNPGDLIFDASQGDGGARLPGVPRQLLERAAELQYEHGTANDMPFGAEVFRRSVVEQYWQIDTDIGIGPHAAKERPLSPASSLITRPWNSTSASLLAGMMKGD